MGVVKSSGEDLPSIDLWHLIAVKSWFRGNPLEVRVTSGQKPNAKVIALYAAVLISSQNKSFSDKNKCWGSYETLESTYELKMMMKFYLNLHNFLNIEIYFLDFPWEIVFGIIQFQLLGNAKRNVKYKWYT